MCLHNTWLKFTEAHLSEVFPMAIFKAKITLKRNTDFRLPPSRGSCLGFAVFDVLKYSCAPMILHAMCTTDRAYGYLKSTLAKAALLSTVTSMLLAIQMTSHRACSWKLGGALIEDSFPSIPRMRRPKELPKLH